MNEAPASAILRAPDDGREARWWRFRSPSARIGATSLEEVPELLERVERATEEGLWAVGCVAYEAAPAFDPALAVRPPAAGLLAAFSLFPPPEPIPTPSGMQPALAARLSPLLDSAEHSAALATIREAIAAGETYQVNFTFPMRSRFTGDPEGLFWSLAPASRAPHAAFLDCGDSAVVSLSPELFFTRTGDRLEMRPMKGTRLRGRFPEEDGRQATELAISAKERAENLMIVDMVRNDLGRIAEAGSVAVESLFALERYPTVWQMTSTVSARSRARLPEIFAALFPCASVTGAPKARTMDWIARLERFPRGVYCGAIGWVAPTRRASFSVAIRTAVIDRTAGTLSYGVGSGVVWDSKPAAEYLECLAKARAFVAPPPPFALFETMLWRPRCGVALLENHLARLAASANYFGFSLDARAWRSAVEAGLAALAGNETQRQRIRLELAPDGVFSFTSGPFRPDRRTWRVVLAGVPVDSQSVSLFHKTTDRRVYDAALAGARAAGADEAILWNERGELTEGTRTNLVLEIGGERLTPPRECGLLAGVFREALLERGRLKEAVLTREDLSRARRVLLVNALRGWIPAALV
ncbi:MAG: aminodeoxychorismate synthase component I [Thermoanaerobaculia bacterium]|nr:aminodeoxychorismate synthase component I [Thermoanaerobaculia bacterium]